MYECALISGGLLHIPLLFSYILQMIGSLYLVTLPSLVWEPSQFYLMCFSWFNTIVFMGQSIRDMK